MKVHGVVNFYCLEYTSTLVSELRYLYKLTANFEKISYKCVSFFYFFFVGVDMFLDRGMEFWKILLSLTLFKLRFKFEFNTLQ